MNWKKSAYFFVSLLVVTGVFYFGYSVGQSDMRPPREVVAALGVESEELQGADFAPFWKAWSVINEKYIDDENVTSQEKVWGAIEGLAGSLDDPYTRFFPPQKSKEFQSSIRGKFGGVGMEVGVRDEILTVVAPLPDTPAEKAGVKSGDKIIEIDGESTREMSVDEAVSKIRGEKGTVVTLTIAREGMNEPLEIEIERSTIDIPTIETESLGSGIYKISVYHFTAGAPNLFRDALREFKNSDNDKLILDLRGNPGGYLEAAVDMSSWFLPSGKVIVKEKMEGTSANVYRSKGYDIFGDDLEMVVLVNQGSASASEIMAAALSEHNVATLVGEKTFGKGSVQELVEITPETSLKITVAKWLTPKGVSFSDKGLEPDVKVEITPEQFEAGEDPQLERAIEILKEGKT